jgi:hypothetical protein
MFTIVNINRVVMSIEHNDDLHHKILSLVYSLPRVLGRL